MNKSVGLTVILLAAGLTALGGGSALLLAPAEWSAMASTDLTLDTNVLVATRLSAGLLLALGLLIVAAVSVPTFTYTPIALSVAHRAYGISRGLSTWLDGLPTELFIQTGIVEWTMGLLSLYFLLRRRIVK
ncbi:MAG: DUF4345 family protein [Gammaproteobacteria bacterium]|nr:DUF4345 family protein [Gammaproteobacteria bacterium]MDH3768456.1 DUF4345 family protein [Gammaproteobacteria bacterium]